MFGQRTKEEGKTSGKVCRFCSTGRMDPICAGCTVLEEKITLQRRRSNLDQATFRRTVDDVFRHDAQF